MQIDPDTEIVQTDFGRQASLKPVRSCGRSRARRKVFKSLSLTVSMIWRMLANQRRKALGQRSRLLV